MKAMVFLGGGRITSALVAGLRLAGYDRLIVVHDRHPRKLYDLKQTFSIRIERDLGQAIRQARMLIIAVRPDSVRPLLERIAPIKHPLTVVSLAAGVPLSKLQDCLGPPVRWARAMPSPVCRSGRGLTAVAFQRGIPLAARREVRDFFASVGTVLEIPEKQFDAFTVSYSSSHGYHALSALTEAAGKIGLDRKSAKIAAAHALADGILAWREGNISLDHMLREAATPGGIAATVMAAMNKAGYGRVVEQGLRAGMKRARKNAMG
jgi:pyrroline-5-carboxylate reductase